MKYAAAFLFFAVYLTGLGAWWGGPAWLLLWPALNAFLLCAGYAGMGPWFLGKRPNGRFALRAFAMLPYLVGTWALWHLLRLRDRRGPSCHLVGPDLWLGRRPLSHELPRDIALVVDLTAELAEPSGVVAGREYVCLPTLDGDAPSDDEFQRVVQRVMTRKGAAYVHCAAGHGRSATVVAAVLITEGLARGPEDAEAQLRAIRPGVGFSRAQMALLQRFLAARSS